MQFKHGAYYFLAQGKWLPLGKDYGAALRLYADLIGAPRNRLTVSDMLTAYVSNGRTRKKPLSAATLDGYEHSATRLRPIFGHMYPEDVKAADLFRYMEAMGDVQANRDRALLSAAYSYYRRTGYEGPDPTKRLQYRNPETPRERYVEDAELERALAAASPKLACIVRFLFLTGMRQGDALRLKVADIDDEGFTYWNAKSKRRQGLDRSAELDSCLEEASRLWRRFGREWLFESRPKGKHAKRGIGPYTPSGLRALWRVARAKAGLQDVRLHDFRAKASSDAASDEEARALLGHTDAKVTRRHYRRRIKRSKPAR
jgi:Site-specific recombinase XerD